jgi:hypothetical protein
MSQIPAEHVHTSRQSTRTESPYEHTRPCVTPAHDWPPMGSAAGQPLGLLPLLVVPVPLAVVPAPVPVVEPGPVVPPPPPDVAPLVFEVTVPPQPRASPAAPPRTRKKKVRMRASIRPPPAVTRRIDGTAGRRRDGT